MTRIILIRHAKSAWDDLFADDHARVLTPRGHESAVAIGKWLVAHHYVPEIILSSDAARAKETAQGVAAALSQPVPIALRPKLYHASPDTILDTIIAESAKVIAVVAHNPGIAMAAHGLVDIRPDHYRFSDYPTAATTVIDFDGAIAPHMGRCVDFVVPRDLMD